MVGAPTRSDAGDSKGIAGRPPATIRPTNKNGMKFHRYKDFIAGNNLF